METLVLVWSKAASQNCFVEIYQLALKEAISCFPHLSKQWLEHSFFGVCLLLWGWRGLCGKKETVEISQISEDELHLSKGKKRRENFQNLMVPISLTTFGKMNTYILWDKLPTDWSRDW